MQLVGHRGQEVVVGTDEQRVPRLPSWVISGPNATPSSLAGISAAATPCSPSIASTSMKSVLGTAAPAQFSLSLQPTHVAGTVQIDQEHVLETGLGAVTETAAIALVDQQLMVVDRHDLADRAVFGFARLADIGQRIGVLGDIARAQVDLDDAGDARCLAAVLDQRTLHRTVERASVRRDRQAFHPLVGETTRAVQRNLVVTARATFATRNAAATDTPRRAGRSRDGRHKRTGRTRRRCRPCGHRD